MKFPPLLLLHMCAGVIGVISGFAALLAVATMSLFFGTPRKVLLPTIIRESQFTYVPILVVLLAMLFWLGRVLLRNDVVRLPRAVSLQRGS